MRAAAWRLLALAVLVSSAPLSAVVLAFSRFDFEPPSSPALATSPECLPTVSCSGRCGEQFVINADASCACDSDCILFGDCCRWMNGLFE